MARIGESKLTIDAIERVIFEDEQVSLDEKALDRVSKSYDFLQSYTTDKVIYGINTGLGPMAQYKIDAADQKQLQLNLIRSHSAGMGPLFTSELSRATMLCRLNSLMQAGSGIHPEAVILLSTLLNEHIYASIPEKGGVGASGDLVQLAHLALNLLGEGDVLVDGQPVPTAEAFKSKGIEPMKVHLREGLALMNGTSAMTGVGFVNTILAKRLLSISIGLSAITNELMKSFDDHFSYELNHVKLHPGQQEIARIMRELLQDSKLIRKRADHLYNKKIEQSILTDKVQEYYSLRCVPQILGPVYDTVLNTIEILEQEVNSVNDNPVVDYQQEHVYHGGNFHGDYVSLEMDKLKMVTTKLCMLAERQLNYLLNDKLNQRLSPFVNLGKLGLNFGVQGMQFTATSTTAENQTLSYPMYIHSIPNNNDNQDIVSMGCNAALLTRRVIQNTFDVLSIQAITIVQAIDYLDCKSMLSSYASQMYTEIRDIVPTFKTDEARHTQLKAVSEYLRNKKSTL